MNHLGINRLDFENLLKQFKACDSVRFERFCEIWKNMKMSYIIAGVESTVEMRQVIEDCLSIALEYCGPENELQDRIGGLYILYAIYYKQPLDPSSRIRVRGDQWNDLKMFLNEIKGQKHLDAEFIFTKLRYDQAFQLVATPSRKLLIKPSWNEEKGEGEGKSEEKTKREQETSILSDIMEPDTIGQLSALHEQYHQMKCFLSGSSKPDESLSCIKNNLVQTITKSVASFEEYRKQKLDPKKVKTRRRKDSGGTTTTSESEADSDFEAWRPKKKKVSKHGELRASLKEKAFSMPVGSRLSKMKQRKDFSPDHIASVSDSGADESDILLSPKLMKQSDTEDESVSGGSPKKSPKRSPRKPVTQDTSEKSPRQRIRRGARVRGAGVRTRGRGRRKDKSSDD